LDRTIRLEGVHNIRDLGGLTTSNGRRVAPGGVFRSGDLGRATASDLAALSALGVGTVVDLRSDWERERNPSGLEARIVPAPIFEGEAVGEFVEDLRAGRLFGEALEEKWRSDLIVAAEAYSDSFRILFDTLGDPQRSGALLFHCSGGKDRTGLAAALFLDALGVEREQIVADYLLTNDHFDNDAVEEFIAQITAAAPEPIRPGLLFPLTRVRAEWLEGVFRSIEDSHGSVEQYVAHRVGIGEAGIRALRDRFLEAAG
jgi:protein-tyrosine phosphatase